jgi:integrase
MKPENVPQEYDNEVIPLLYKHNPGLDEKYVIKRQKFALTIEQRDDLLRTAKERNAKHYLMIRFELETGLRVSEIVNLAIHQINLNTGHVEIETRMGDRYVKKFRPKTEAGNRTVKIGSGLLDLVRQYIGKRTRGYVFLSNKGNGKPYWKQSVINFINKYAKLAPSIQRSIGSHTLRRTYASFLLQDGEPISSISKSLGHASIRTTMCYLFQIQDLSNLDSIVERMARISNVEY